MTQVTTQVEKAGSNKLNLLQLCRFIAALTVVVCHNSFYTFERLNDDVAYWREGSRGVALFFVISGFVMLYSTSRVDKGQFYDWRLFILRRSARIVPLYWFATTFKLIILLGMSGLVLHAEFEFFYVLKSYFFIPSLNVDGKVTPLLGVGWTLVYEMFFYIVFSFMLFLRKDAFIGTTMVMAFFILLSVFRTESWPVLLFFLADPIVFDFILGMIAAKICLSNRALPNRMFIGILALISLAILFFPSEPIRNFMDSIGQISDVVVGVLSFFIVMAAVLYEREFGDRVPNWILYLSGASYSLYLIHPLSSPLVPQVMSKLLPIASSGVVWYWVSAFAGVLFAIVVSSLVFSFFEEPVTKLLNRKIKTLLSAKDVQRSV